jgi:hypothetical protein
MLPIAAEIATRLTREQAQSARPHAPVVPVEETRPRTSFVSGLIGRARRRTDRKGPSSAQSPTYPRRPRPAH